MKSKCGVRIRKTQNIVHSKVAVIWLTDRRLYARDGTIRTLSSVIVSVKTRDPFPVIGEELPLAVYISVRKEGL